MATTTASQSNDNVMAAVATLPVVGLIMFFAMKDASPLVKNYAKQSNAVLAIEIAMVILSVIIGIITIAVPALWMVSWVGSLLNLVSLVAWILLLVNALQGKMYKLPVIGDFFDGLLK